MRIGSLFSGIGGLELGLEWAGVGHTVWQVEQDAWCRERLAEKWPAAKRFDDVHTVGSHNLEPVDVICGGYPCQPFSIAGKKGGESDPRHLWPQFARLLGELRPRFAVLENVPNHLALGFGRVLGDLSELGYYAEWDVVSAGGIGAHHLRRRLFGIAYLPHAVRCGPQGKWAAKKGSWTRQQLEGLVQAALRLSVPAGRSGGVSDGIPDRLHRLKALGNAVVPQVAEVVGRRLMELADERAVQEAA